MHLAVVSDSAATAEALDRYVMPWLPRKAVGSTTADRLVEVMRSHPLGRDAAIIGEVVSEHAGMVTLRSLIGGERVVTMLAGEQLPRIC